MADGRSSSPETLAPTPEKPRGQNSSPSFRWLRGAAAALGINALIAGSASAQVPDIPLVPIKPATSEPPRDRVGITNFAEEVVDPRDLKRNPSSRPTSEKMSDQNQSQNTQVEIAESVARLSMLKGQVDNLLDSSRRVMPLTEQVQPIYHPNSGENMVRISVKARESNKSPMDIYYKDNQPGTLEALLLLTGHEVGVGINRSNAGVPSGENANKRAEILQSLSPEDQRQVEQILALKTYVKPGVEVSDEGVGAEEVPEWTYARTYSLARLKPLEVKENLKNASPAVRKGLAQIFVFTINSTLARAGDKTTLSDLGFDKDLLPELTDLAK